MSSVSTLKLTSTFSDGYTFFGENTQVVLVPSDKRDDFLLELQQEFDNQKENNEKVRLLMSKINSYFKELFYNKKHTKRVFLNTFKKEPVILEKAKELEEEGLDMEDSLFCVQLSSRIGKQLDNRSQEDCVKHIIEKMDILSLQDNVENISIDNGEIIV